MTALAIIGGSGLTALKGLEIKRQQMQQTPYGEPSGPLTFGILSGKEIVFLPRHGNPHVIPPHKINYRANIWALKENRIKNIISVNAVGGITKEMYPGRLVIPENIIDYTWSRKHTYFEENINEVTHVDFTRPYCEELREHLINAGHVAKLNIFAGGTYGATQGPRLETASEIERMERDGCDLVGMTGMPEAALARELELNYASISVVVNRAAGKSDEAITMDMIEKNLKSGIEKACQLLEAAIPII
jgi:5''-deoxy-5''-methylthioadenosine phosphorylase